MRLLCAVQICTTEKYCSFFVCLFTQICNCLLTSATKTRIITMIVSNLLCRCGYKTVTIVARRRMRLRAASLP